MSPSLDLKTWDTPLKATARGDFVAWSFSGGTTKAGFKRVIFRWRDKAFGSPPIASAGVI
jgi:hypothetical protein